MMILSFATDLIGKRVEVLRADDNTWRHQPMGYGTVRGIGPSQRDDAHAVVILEIDINWPPRLEDSSFITDDQVPAGYLVAIQWDGKTAFRVAGAP